MANSEAVERVQRVGRAKLGAPFLTGRHADRGGSVSQRIRAYPDDDAQRLIFADWLDEEGDPRGGFIRVQMRSPSCRRRPARGAGLLRAERDLLGRTRDEWAAPFRGLATGPVFRRGFVDEVKVDARQFLRPAHEIFAAGPVRHVHLLDVGGSLPAVLESPYLGRLSALTVTRRTRANRSPARSPGAPHLAGLKRLR